MNTKFFNLFYSLLTLLPLVIISETNAQLVIFEKNVPAYKIDKKDGLSNTAITSSAIDIHGNLWLGSWDNLNKLENGKNYIYKPTQHENSISNNVILKLLYPSNEDDRIWILTKGGINTYDSGEDKFHSYLTHLPNESYNESSVQFESFKEEIWVYLKKWGIGRYHADTDDFTVTITPEFLAENNISSEIKFTKVEKLYYIYDLINRKISILRKNNQDYNIVKQVPIQQKIDKAWIFNHANSVVLAGQLSANKKLMLFDGIKEEIRTFNTITNPSCINYSQNNIWVGTTHGEVYKIERNNNKWEVKNYSTYLSKIRTSQLKILEINELANGIILISTDGDGVYILNDNENDFQTLHYNNGKGEGEPINLFVRAILPTEHGLLMGTKSKGLHLINPNQNLTHIPSKSTSVLCLGRDRQNNIWVGYDEQGLTMMESKTQKQFDFPADFKHNHQGIISKSNVYSITTDYIGNIWIGTSGHGVFKFSVSKNSQGEYSLNNYLEITDKDGLTNPVVYAICEEKPNILWFGTRGSGLFRYNSLQHKITHHVNGSKYGIGDLDVLSIVKNQGKDEIIIGTSSGLYTVSAVGNDYKIKPMANEETGLANNTIHSITQDITNSIWVSTNNGISKIEDSDTLNIVNFNFENGLNNYEFSDNSYARLPNDQIIFGGHNGIDIFYPNDISNKVPDFKVQFSKLSTNQQEKNISSNSKIVLNNNESSFSIYCNIPIFNFVYPNYKFKYRLSPMESEWNTTDSHELRYTNIPSGAYTLEVIPEYNNHKFNTQNKTILHIQVKQSIWESVFVKVGLLILVCLIILVVLKLKQYRKKERLKYSLLDEKIKKHQHKSTILNSLIQEIEKPLSVILPSADILNNKLMRGDDSKFSTAILECSKLMRDITKEFKEYNTLSDEEYSVENELVNVRKIIHEVVSIFEKHDKNILFKINSKKEISEWMNESMFKYTFFKILYEITLACDSNETVLIDYKIADCKLITSFKIKNNSQVEAVFKGKTTNETWNMHLINALTKNIHAKIDIHTTEPETTIYLLMEIVDNSNTIPGNSHKFVKEEIELKHEIPAVQHLPTHLPNQKNIIVLNCDSYFFNVICQSLQNEYNFYPRSNFDQCKQLLDNSNIHLIIFNTNDNRNEIVEFCKKIKNKHEHIPIIELSSISQKEYKVKSLELGVSSFIHKPFYPKHLKIRVEQLLNKDFNPSIVQKDDHLMRLTKSPDTHFKDPDYTIEQWASDVNISKSHLYKIMKDQTGKSPFNYLLKKRIDYSVELLKNESLNINEVIFQSGFNNRVQYHRAFQKFFDLTPSKYRLKYKK